MIYILKIVLKTYFNIIKFLYVNLVLVKTSKSRLNFKIIYDFKFYQNMLLAYSLRI